MAVIMFLVTLIPWCWLMTVLGLADLISCCHMYNKYIAVRWDFWHMTSTAGLTVWNSLPEDLRGLECFADSYRQSLKTFLFSQYYCVQCLRGFYVNALYKFTFDIHSFLAAFLAVLAHCSTGKMQKPDNLSRLLHLAGISDWLSFSCWWLD